MRSLILSSVLILLFACARPGSTVNSAVPEVPSSAALKSVYNHTDSTFLYKTAVDVYEHYLSGLLFIKCVGDNHYRLVFTTEVGVKLFDFEIGPDGLFVVHYCFEKMNKKVVLNLLEEDFRLMLLIPPFLSENAYVKSDSTGKYYTLKGKKEENLYFFDPAGNLRETRNNYGRRRSKMKLNIIFANYSAKVPMQIDLKHRNIKLEISMRYLKR